MITRLRRSMDEILHAQKQEKKPEVKVIKTDKQEDTYVEGLLCLRVDNEHEKIYTISAKRAFELFEDKFSGTRFPSDEAHRCASFYAKEVLGKLDGEYDHYERVSGVQAIE